MNKNQARLLFLFLALAVSAQTMQIHAWGLTSIVRTLNSSIHRSARMCENIRRPLAILAVTAAVFVGTLWLYNHYRQTQSPAATPTPQNPPITQQPSLFARIWNWFKPQPTPTIPTTQAQTAERAPIATEPSSNPAPEASNQVRPSTTPPANQQPANQPPAIPAAAPAPRPSLAERMTMPVEVGYQPATNDQLAVVPYFNDPNNLVGPLVEFQNPNDGAHVIVQQIRVLSQFGDSDIDERNASCGLHAVKNSAGFVGLVNGRNTGTMLTGREEADELLGLLPQGILRRTVDLWRKKRALRDRLAEQVIRQAPLNPQVCEDIDTMRSAYMRMLEHFFEQQINGIEQGGELNIEPQVIVDNLAQIEVHPSYRAHIAFLHNRENIARYINSENPIHVTQNDLNNALTDYNRRHPNRLRPAPEQIPLNGEACEANEISNLLRMPFLAQIIGNIPYTVADYPQEGESVHLIHNHIFLGTLPAQRSHLFIVGAGHWIVLLGEFAHGHRRWTIAEPARNNLRIFDSAATDVIVSCEGRQVGELLRPS